MTVVSSLIRGGGKVFRYPTWDHNNFSRSDKDTGVMARVVRVIVTCLL